MLSDKKMLPKIIHLSASVQRKKICAFEYLFLHTARKLMECCFRDHVDFGYTVRWLEVENNSSEIHMGLWWFK